MDEPLNLERIDAVVRMIRTRTELKPEVGIILGSGLGALADDIESDARIPYDDLPGWPVSTVQGHMGQLVIGELEGKPVVVMQGRAHFYEGYSMAQVGLPVRVMQRMGVSSVFITNAAGAVNPDFEPGDLMLITDHLNLLGMMGQNPLRGPNLDVFGPRFPDMSRVYDRDLLALARKVGREQGMALREGVYVCLAGPSYETPADLRFLRFSGVDAVGMSTVPEATVARHGGTRVLGVSGISNKANLDGETLTTHEEVLEAGSVLGPKIIALLRAVLRAL
ncbi:MAG: purine-nucleoside phosphorylase [Chloroflexi bacterium]|nr:purine-nucleoside phosphorylase [Chloroflexota bacterium]